MAAPASPQATGQNKKHGSSDGCCDEFLLCTLGKAHGFTASSKLTFGAVAPSDEETGPLPRKATDPDMGSTIADMKLFNGARDNVLDLRGLSHAGEAVRAMPSFVGPGGPPSRSGC